MKITTLKKCDFEKMYSIMEQAFPSAERRKKESQIALLDNPLYCISVYKDKYDILAFAASWNLGSFIFIEHLAVSHALRGKGIGTQFLEKYKDTAPLPIILEVEDTNTDIAKKRIEFYKRLGFKISDVCYIQPTLDHSNTLIPLRMMYYGDLNNLTLSDAKEIIFKEIYKISENGENLK